MATREPLDLVVRAEPGDDTECARRARELAAELRLTFDATCASDPEICLEVTPDRLQLRWHGDPHGHGRRSRPTFVDFSRIDVRPGPGATHSQPLARAVGLRKADEKPRVLDATAGFGEDSWVLAALGCEVIAIERIPFIAALLRDGVARAAAFAPTIAARLKLLEGDARDHLVHDDRLAWRPDVIYLDPMFPARAKSALEEKRMRLLRRMVGDDVDAGELLVHAREVARRRVVVKRPLRAQPLAEKPVSSHQGKSLRYDVYLTNEDRGLA